MPPRPGALFSFFVLSLLFFSFHYMYIEIDHLCKRVVARDTDGVRRERVILDDITLSIDRGEFVCLLGFSGCGKSTLLKLLAGFDQPTSGHITVDGQPVTRPSSSRVMIFQQYGLLPWRTVEQNVMLGLEAQRLPRVDRQRLAEEYLCLVGLSDQARNFPARLSGGQQQRVALARGLAVNPQVLFMDEPFAALDPITRHRLQDDLLRIVSERSKTVVFVTHDIHEAIYLADRIVVLSSSPGRVRRVLTIDSPRPRSRDSGAFARQYDLLYHELYSLSKQPIEYYI